MTNGREPSNTPVPDSGGESERRKWTHKRAQFDSAINTARLLGVVQNIAMGNMESGEALRIILEVNEATDQAQYVAEMLAMKKEFRELARLDFIPEIAKFIRDGSRLVPGLTEGLASQMLMAMGHAAQNDAYLETVSSAVSTLLSDLDHPLMTDARNYLRLLWDQMEATRKLKQTEARYTGQTDASDREPFDERRSSGSMAKAKATALLDVPLTTSDKPSAPAIAVNPPSVPGLRKATMIGVGEARPAAPSVPRQRIAEARDSASKVERASSPSVPRHRIAEVSESASKVERTSSPPVPQHRIAEITEVVLQEPQQIVEVPREENINERETASHDDDFEDVTRPHEVPEAVHPEPQTIAEFGSETRPIEKWFDTETESPKREETVEEFKLPTKGVPRWAVATVLVTALAAAGVVVALVSEPEQKSSSPASSAPGKAKPREAPSARAASSKALPTKSPVPPPPPVTPSQAPAAPTPPALKPHEPAIAAVSPPKASRSATEVAAPRQAKISKAEPATKAPAEPNRVVEPVPKSTVSPVMTPADVSKTLSPLDRIVAELRLISPDPVGIEDKARELARIIARSKRKEASQIIENLGPPIAVDPLGRDANLEDSLQTFAVSVLGRVATDDDDNRAVDALLMLGDWVKDGGKGKQKALSALQTLSHESIIKTSAPRLRALKTAQAQAD